MKPSGLLKIVTVCGFILLIVSFVLYRSGNFDTPRIMEVASLNSMAVDTPKVKTEDSVFVMPEIMPSSKSGVIFRDVIPSPTDSTKKTPKK
jgi:hypothetical protein